MNKLKSIGFSFAIDEGLEALEASAPPVDEDGVPATMPTLAGKPSQGGTVAHQKQANPSQQPSVLQGVQNQADATTKLSEYNIAIHLAGLADKNQGGDTGRGFVPPAQGSSANKQVGDVVLLENDLPDLYEAKLNL